MQNRKRNNEKSVVKNIIRMGDLNFSYVNFAEYLNGSMIIDSIS